MTSLAVKFLTRCLLAVFAFSSFAPAMADVPICIDATQDATATAVSASTEAATPRGTAASVAPLVETNTKYLRAQHTAEKLKVGLVLGGGGARGAAHVGVLKILKQEKVPIDMVVGTSMGAIVGGFYCAEMPLTKIEHLFSSCSLMKSYMTLPFRARMAVTPIMTIPRVAYHPYDGLSWGIKFRGFINRQLPDNERNIEDLKIPFAAMAVDLIEGKLHALTKGNLSRALQASSAVPGLRKPVQIGDRLFVDGGVLENVPSDAARDMGADVIIAVNVDEKFEKQSLKTFRKMGSVSTRVVGLQLHKMDDTLVNNKQCVLIHPEVTGIGLLSTKKADALRAIKAGETAALQAMPAIRKCLKDVDIQF